MTPRWRGVVSITLGLLLLTLAVDEVVSKTLTNPRNSSELTPPAEDRIEDSILSPAGDNPDIKIESVESDTPIPGGPWGLNLDFSWLFVCPECDFISKIGMKKMERSQNEL